MKTFNLIRGLLCYAAFSLSGCLFHRPAFYPAQVLMKDGALCFSVANNREERANPPEISVITVSSETEEGEGALWYRAFRSQSPMNISPHDCLVYGKKGHAPALRQGLHYRVIMNAYINENNRRYHAYFCLYETPEGELKIHHAKWSNNINGRDWRMCEQ